jgi:hypothetical protein
LAQSDGARVVLDAGSADGSDSSLEVIVLPQAVAKPVERLPLPATAVKIAEVRELTVSRESESVAIRVEQRSVVARRDSTGGHRSTFSILSRAVSDV